MHDLGIIFVHHAIGPTTANNLEMVRRMNPNAVVVTVSQHGETFPGGYNIRDMYDGPWRPYRQRINEYGWRSLLREGWRRQQRTFIWWNADMAIYLWYAHKREEARRWIVVEWDVLCLEPMQSFYRDVWDADVAAANIKRLDDTSRWVHFSDFGIALLPAEYRKAALGLTPLAGMLFSDDALREISAAVARDARLRGVYCELRTGTVAKHLGFDAVEIGGRSRRTLDDDREYNATSIEEPGLWHKVKDHDPLLEWPRTLAPAESLPGVAQA